MVKTILSLIVILALTLPLFLMPISAADKEPTVDELVKLTRDSEAFLYMLYYYKGWVKHRNDPSYKFDQGEKEYFEKAKEWGYFDPEFEYIESTYPFSAVDLQTGEIHKDIYTGCGVRFPDTVTVEKVRKDIKRFFVSDFLGLMDNGDWSEGGTLVRIFLSTDGHLYQNHFGLYPIINEVVYGRPDLSSAKLISKTDKKIVLSFDYTVFEDVTKDGNIEVHYSKTSAGWRISGATGGYYGTYFHRGSVFAPEVPDTADNSVVYIALASVSLVALAGAVLASKRKKSIPHKKSIKT